MSCLSALPQLSIIWTFPCGLVKLLPSSSEPSTSAGGSLDAYKWLVTLQSSLLTACPLTAPALGCKASERHASVAS